MIRFLIEKEFKQIGRHSFLPRLIFIFPIMVMFVIPWAANQEIKNIKLSVIDNDHSAYSEQLIYKITASGYFRLTNVSTSNHQALKSMEAGKTDIILEIQPDFEKDLIKTGNANVMISANSVNGSKAGLGSAYLVSIINEWSRDNGMTKNIQLSNLNPLFLFNPKLDYKVFMIPALMVMLLTILTGFLPALNIVGEKEAGTTEQLNVTPVKKITFILAKLIPYWILGLIVLSICLSLASAIYDLYPAGSLATIYLYAIVYILVVSGFGIVISNYSDAMQQAMFVMYFFILIIILLSGLFTPINSMPDWAQAITVINPLKYFIEVMRSVYLKGSSITELLPQFFALCGFALFFNIWAVLSYKKNR
jgi:ABC-2 type transport system permease protein